MGRIARIFLAGLLVLLPLAITIAFALWLVGTAEMVLGNVLRAVISDRTYRSGMGLLTAIVLVFATGLLTETRWFRSAFDRLDDIFSRIPLVRTVYGAVRDLMLFVTRRGARKFNRVVLISFPQVPVRLIGFVTLEDFAELQLDLPPATIAVYLPMSYQIGGYLVFIPRDYLTPVDMTMEEAMRFVLTAGMSRS